jgi:hypothetical protein
MVRSFKLLAGLPISSVDCPVKSHDGGSFDTPPSFYDTPKCGEVKQFFAYSTSFPPVFLIGGMKVAIRDVFSPSAAHLPAQMAVSIYPSSGLIEGMRWLAIHAPYNIIRV